MIISFCYVSYHKILETISTSLSLPGSQVRPPTDLPYHPMKTLYIANADIIAAVFDVSKPGRSQSRFIPVGWYPTM